MARAATTSAEKLLPLPLQFLAAWIGMWLGEHLKGAPAPANENGRVQRRERLGGLLNYYHRNAA
jgi:hypothetical protein